MNPALFPNPALGFTTGLGVAFVVGLGFGFFLERAGLGNGRKLAAQFYLTDLTVFKVMFSAIVTAMLGLSVLSEVGLVDLSRIYLTPTFLLPQIVGGLIFGIGFVMGGYCPGTSCVAVSTGRSDAIALFGGMMVGVLAFAELFPMLVGFYDLTPMGAVTLADLIGVHRTVVVFGVVVMALACFAFAERMERRNGSRIVVPE